MKSVGLRCQRYPEVWLKGKFDWTLSLPKIMWSCQCNHGWKLKGYSTAHCNHQAITLNYNYFMLNIIKPNESYYFKCRLEDNLF